MEGIPFARPGDGAAPIRLATVIDARNGAAVRVRDSAGSVRRVTGHGSAVPHLLPGDMVVVAATGDGCVVLDRLRAPDEAPAARVEQHADGSVSVWAEGAIRLHTRGTTLELHPDGRLTAGGRALELAAAEDLNLRGGRIRLN